MIVVGSYTRKRDGITCSYRAECSEWGADVTWNARVYAGDHLVGSPAGKLLLVPVSATDLEHAIRHVVEAFIEAEPNVQSHNG